MKHSHWALLLVALLLWGREVPAALPNPASVRAAIDSFAPYWLPPRDELSGWAAALDPGDGARLGSEQRLDDDLSLLTAAHLYHLIDGAGGGAVLLRSDDTLATSSGRRRLTDRFDAVRARRCDLCISIRYAPGRREASAAGGGDRPSDIALGEALRAALGGRAQGPVPANSPAALNGQHAAPAMCIVELPRPPDMAAIDPAARRVCFENARRLYAGIRAFCAAAQTPPAQAESRPTSQRGDTPDVRGPASSLGRKLWPNGCLPADQLDWFCRLYAQVCISDVSLVYFDVSVVVDGTVALRGSTNVPAVVHGLVEALRDVGYDRVRNDVHPLPDRERLGTQLFGVCRAPMALTSARPGNKGGRQTQLLYGEPLFLLDQREDCYLVLAGDGYWGWTDDSAVEPLTAEQFDAYVEHPGAIVQRDIVRDGISIPRGARVRLADSEARPPRILLTDGTALGAPPESLRVEIPDDAAARRVGAALELLYVPYVFGGRSPLGTDCSGLIASSYVREGRSPARDVWQQAFAGQLVATGWHRTNIRMGDQLLFMHGSGKLYHTGIALDATHFVHSSPPGVQISSLDPCDRLYDEEWDRTFFMAKRP